ncbi:TPA: DUF2622 domain-containing protein [Serratia liquefaciens]|nr:DUF2622 domain-containing protein [Serratia liquefaciens]
MAKFIVRVELRNSESADYDALHEKMSSHGFYKFAKFPGDEQNFTLPNAEYLFYGVKASENINYVGYLARAVAEKIRTNPKILVTEMKDSLQLGLDKF